MNMSPENKAHFESEKEAIHLILTGIGDEIYLTADARQIAQEMWEAIERFYKPMNEMIRNNLIIATMQVNVQFLQQLQPEWSSSSHLFSPLRDTESLNRRRNLGEPSILFDFEEVMNNSHNQEPPPQNDPPPMVRPNGQAPRTMEELCQPSINGRGGPIASIPIQATDFGLCHHMI
nr:reverse transcriptase domain-containing protein [Tanacetum cinerariifolium]